MFERTLADLIRGLRASNKNDEAKFIALAVDEIRKEVRTKDMELKAAAVLKLTYLDMLGYDMSWASFHVVEVMSSPRAHLKAVGYLAAVQSFKEDTDVLMLTTNTLKKDITSPSPSDIAIALDGLSHIVTSDLARDLSHDLYAMLNHSRPRIRKRAVLVLYKVFVKYPDALVHSFGRLREKLEDPDLGVVSATINILCELARRDPQNYLPLAPQLFDILTKSSNNWMLIKVIKLFGALTPLEPRLAKKLQKPITDLISTTPAVSLLYECVHTCIVGGMLEGHAGNALAKTCVDKLSAFLRDPDQNLKYIALLALVKIVPTHPHLVAVHQDVIVASIDDQDISIRMRALDLVSSMVTEYNLQSIVQQLLSHLVPADDTATFSLPSAAQTLARAVTATSPNAPVTTSSDPSSSVSTTTILTPAYRLEVAHRIIGMCSRGTYENVTDFEWYTSVLVDLVYITNVSAIGLEIKDQLLDVAVRVRAVRGFMVGLMVKLLNDDILLQNCKDEGSCTEALSAAAWICGEYCNELTNPQQVIDLLIQPAVHLLPPAILSVYLQSTLKIFGHWSAEISKRWDEDFLPETKKQVTLILDSLKRFSGNPDFEVQERAANMLQLFTFIRADLNNRKTTPPVIDNVKDGDDENENVPSTSSSDPPFPKSLYLIRPLHARELNAIAPGAQHRVAVPEGLDLDNWIVPPSKLRSDAVYLSDESGSEQESGVKKGKKGKSKGKVDGDSAGGTSKSKGKSGVKRKKKDGLLSSSVLTPETPEEIAAREKRREERLAQQRDDPYYLVDNRASGSKPLLPHESTNDDDLDNIPIVRLDDLIPSAETETSHSRPSSSLRSSRSAKSTPVVIDRGGEMPTGAIAMAPDSPSLPASLKQPTPLSSLSRQGSGINLFGGAASHLAMPTPLSGGFQPYVVEDEGGMLTPDPVKVTKVKKKTSTKPKRKAKGDIV